MKKSHLALLVITAVMALSSAYSLAAINQVYKIDFEWYSQYKSAYSKDARITYGDRWLDDEYPSGMRFYIIRAEREAEGIDDIRPYSVVWPSRGEYLLLHCSLGRAGSPEYRLKIADIAQRGSTVEVMVSLNSSEKDVMPADGSSPDYLVCDTVRVYKKAFPVRGRLLFIFKDQYGRKLWEKYCEV